MKENKEQRQIIDEYERKYHITYDMRDLYNIETYYDEYSREIKEYYERIRVEIDELDYTLLNTQFSGRELILRRRLKLQLILWVEYYLNRKCFMNEIKKTMDEIKQIDDSTGK